MALTFFDAFTRIGPRPRVHHAHPWSLQHLLDEMDHCSISAAMVAATAQTLYDPMFENLRLVEKLAPHDHLFPLWNVMPHWLGDFPEPAELTAQMRKHDVRAVTIYPHTNGWHVTSRTSSALFKELEQNQTLVILDYREFDPRDLEPLMDLYPTLPLLIRGVTWSQQRLIEPQLRTHKSLHLGFDYYQVNLAPERLVKLGLEDQIVFCSNAPEMSAGAHRFYVDYSDLPPATKAKFAGGNLSRLLKGLKPPRERVNKNEDAIMAEAREGKPLSTLVIDMHAHMLDEGLHGAGGAYGMYDGGPSGVHRLAKRMGVDAIGIMSWNGTVGVHAEEGNQCVIKALDAFPDFYWGLATTDVLHETPEQMLANFTRIFQDKRFLGLKPYPQYGIPYSDPRYDTWWNFGNQRHLYCGLHPHNWYSPAELESVCSRFPDLTVVAFHGGGSYEIADACIGVARKYPNFLIEVTLTPVCCGVIDYLCQHAGADRVVYGSDLPMRDPRQQLGWCVYSRLNIDDKKRVLGGNARRLIEHVWKHNA